MARRKLEYNPDGTKVLDQNGNPVRSRPTSYAASNDVIAKLIGREPIESIRDESDKETK